MIIHTAMLLSTLTIGQPAIDKIAHFGVAGTAQVACTALMNKLTDNKTASNIGCFVAISAASIAKEIVDPHMGHCREFKDAAYSIGGAGVSLIAIQWGF